MLDIQALVDGMSARHQRERAEAQMTLGKLIAALEAMPSDAQVANLNSAQLPWLLQRLGFRARCRHTPSR